MNITTTIFAAVLITGASADGRPEWATESVPDSLVALVERAVDTADADLRKELLVDAERYAREAVTAGGERDVGRHYALAVVLGLRANVEGGRSKVRAAAELFEELELILAIDPHHVGARHMLGRLHAGVRRMNGVVRWLATNMLGGEELARARWETAEENLAYAEEHGPTVADHHLQLALLYRDTGRPELAAQELAHTLELEPRNALEVAVRDEALRVRSELGQ
jgi:tetratricopeptide (TPR) repeat protein